MTEPVGSHGRRSDAQLRDDALAIWRAAVAAVDSRRLIQENVHVNDGRLTIGSFVAELAAFRRIAVVGGGKAGAGMAAGLCDVLEGRLDPATELRGWVNVPADCVADCGPITLHPARPAGRNEPTAEGVEGTQQILRLVQSLGSDDLCLCLLSGGGSALLPAPVPGVALEDKQEVTRLLSGAGANIQQLNTVRKQLSQIKGGRLAQHCRARALVTLIISDVIGDPLDVIASGPTTPDPCTAQDALDVLAELDPNEQAPESIYRYLREQARRNPPPVQPACPVQHVVIGNNALAVDAAGMEAERRGYSHAMRAGQELEGSAEEVGRRLAELALRMRESPGPDCLITGGEPTVTLAPPDLRGRGGRNQQLVLAALRHWIETAPDCTSGVALLSGGTDGEDGPTDAAGAIVDGRLLAAWKASGLDLDDYLRRNDAYSFFAQLQGLIQTGPTHTNVCDVRVAVVDRVQGD